MDHANPVADDKAVGGLGGRLAAWFETILRTGRLPAFLIAAGCGVVVYGFLFSGDYAVSDVVVVGVELSDPAEVAAQASVMGASVFRVDPERAAEEIAALPYVHRVSVHAEYPSSVRIEIVEREPVLAWQAENGVALLDERGNVLKIVNGAELPVVQGEGTAVEPGDQVPVERVTAVLAVHDQLGGDVDVMTWSTLDGLSVRLHDKRTVIFGDPGKMSLKLTLYRELIGAIEDAWTVLDLREPDRPAYS